jgi:rare lipoprotein A
VSRAIAVAALALVAGCATTSTSSPTTTPTQTPTHTPTQTPTKFTQTGKASWYGKEQHGGPTASGERFNMYQMTCAHRTLRFGTMVEVENLKNGRRVTVRVNDRGPFSRGRIIDVSYAAAKQLEMIDAGIVPVRIVVR